MDSDGVDYLLFGHMVWGWIEKNKEFFNYEESEELMEIAKACGLARRVKYDPAKHGDMEADLGDEVWFWGEEATPVSAEASEPKPAPPV